MKPKIAVVQFKIKQEDPKHNLKRAESFLKKAKGKADIIVFPEDFITGPIEHAPKLDDTTGKYRKHFQKLAKRYNIDIVAGTWIEKEKNKRYNTCYYINSNGKIRAKYRKMHLWDNENKAFTPGNEAEVINTRYGKIGLCICWDMAFPEVFRQMMKKGVQIVICPSYWSYEDAGAGIKYRKDSEALLIDASCVHRAFENEIIFVFCNAAGKTKIGKYKLNLVGHSQVTVPFKGAIKKLKHNREEMFIQQLDLSILEAAEKNYRIRRDLK